VCSLPLRLLALLAFAGSPFIVHTQPARLQWDDLPPTAQATLNQHGISGRAAFDRWRDRVRAANAARLRDGDFDHLIHYALQSRRLTPLPPIEPALSAKTFVEAFPPDDRARLLAGGRDRPADAAASRAAHGVASRAGGQHDDGPDAAVLARVPRDAAARLSAMANALTGSSQDARLAHFRDVAGAVRGAALEALLRREYVRAMRFLYEKEFVAQRSAQREADVATLYRTRGHSSDTEIEAGYGVYVALASVQQIEPRRRIQRVLIVGPGLDLAPRTGMIEEAEPQSYQPFAVADALLGLGLSDRTTLRIEAADLNPHVARAIARAIRTPALRLFVTSGIADDRRTQMTGDYRAYLTTFGRAIGTSERNGNDRGTPAGTAPASRASSGTAGAAPDNARPGSATPGSATATAGAPANATPVNPAPVSPTPGSASPIDRAPSDRTSDRPAADGHIRKIISVAPDAQATIAARQLDIVTDRAAAPRPSRPTDAAPGRPLPGGNTSLASVSSFDLVIVTNVFPYLGDDELVVGLANIAAALAPGGLLIHNEARPLMMSATAAAGLPAILARTLLIAKVPAGRDLYDTICIHKKP